MKINTVKKGTAFTLIKRGNIDTIIQSNKVYPSGSYNVSFSSNMQGSKLEIAINNILAPMGPDIAVMAPARAYIFKNYDDKSPLGYDQKTLTIKGPVGSKIEIILKDNYQNPGTEDTYECIL